MAEAMQPTHTDPEGVTKQPPLAPDELAPYLPQLEILECLGRGGMEGDARLCVRRIKHQTFFGTLVSSKGF